MVELIQPAPVALTEEGDGADGDAHARAPGRQVVEGAVQEVEVQPVAGLQNHAQEEEHQPEYESHQVDGEKKTLGRALQIAHLDLPAEFLDFKDVRVRNAASPRGRQEDNHLLDNFLLWSQKKVTRVTKPLRSLNALFRLFHFPATPLDLVDFMPVTT